MNKSVAFQAGDHGSTPQWSYNIFFMEGLLILNVYYIFSIRLQQLKSYWVKIVLQKKQVFEQLTD